MHPLNSVKGAITTGVVLAVVIGLWLTAWAGVGPNFYPVRVNRWLHILSGVMWIGLLYYFNVVQTPGLAAAAADKGGPVARVYRSTSRRGRCCGSGRRGGHLGDRSDIPVGRLSNGDRIGIVSAFTLQPGFRTIGVGAWLGTIMLINVWVFIWPKSKKILGLVPATDDEKAAARKTAGRASRINFILRCPCCCVGQPGHGLPF